LQVCARVSWQGGAPRYPPHWQGPDGRSAPPHDGPGKKKKIRNRGWGPAPERMTGPRGKRGSDQKALGFLQDTPARPQRLRAGFFPVETPARRAGAPGGGAGRYNLWERWRRGGGEKKDSDGEDWVFKATNLSEENRTKKKKKKAIGWVGWRRRQELRGGKRLGREAFGRRPRLVGKESDVGGGHSRSSARGKTTKLGKERRKKLLGAKNGNRGKYRF